MLKFKCPNCNSHKIARRVKGEHVEIYSVSKDGLYLEGDENTGVESVVWECGQCDFVLTNNDKEPMLDEEQVLAWIEQNCG